MKFKSLKTTAVLSVLLGFAGFAYAHMAAQSLVCKPGGSETPIQSLRLFFWIAAGFPSEEAYACFHEDIQERKDIVDMDGLIGRINTIRTEVVQAILAAGYTNCLGLPEDGTQIPLSNKGTLTFGVPSRKPPTNFPVTETYHKKVTFVSNSNPSRKAEFEFHCGRSSMMVKFEDASGGKSQKMSVFYDGERDLGSEKYISFFLHDEGNLGDEVNMWLSLIIHDGGVYNLWITRTGETSGDFAGYRFAATGDVNTGKASVFFRDVSGLYTMGDYQTDPERGSIDVSSTNAPADATNKGDTAQGCVSDFNVQPSSITSNALCSGLSLSAHPQNTLETGSKMSLLWVQDAFPTWLSGL